MSARQQAAFLLCVALVIAGSALLGGVGVALLVSGVLLGVLILVSEF